MRLNDLWNMIIRANAGISENGFLSREMQYFMSSDKYNNMVIGRKYYLGDQDINNKVRTMIVEGNQVVSLDNLPNNKICDNKVDDLVDQKVNYLFSKPIEVKTDNDKVIDVFNRDFHRKLNGVARDAYIGGIAYLYPYFDKTGTLQFKRLKPENVIPFWRDEEHTILDAFIYFYDLEVYGLGGVKQKKTYVEYYREDRISYFIYENGQLTPDTEKNDAYYIELDGDSYTWGQVPLIAFKANDAEQPLICRVKCLQDALNTMYSNFADNMQEDSRNTILVIKNYDGEDLAQFRRNLATYGAVKVRTVDGVGGDVDTLEIKVDASNYGMIMEALKKSIIENGRGFDAKDERMANNPNQMNIMSMYSDIDLDADQMEMQFQASFEKLMEFVNMALNIKSEKTADGVEFIFNRNTPVNEGDTINNCRNSVGVLSMETIVANHPWTMNTKEELERLKAEQMAQLDPDYIQGSALDE